MNPVIPVCRLCLRDDPDHAFKNDDCTNSTENFSELPLTELVLKYLPVQIMTSESSEPPIICDCCASQIKQWHRFYTTCIDNDKIYHERLSEQLVHDGAVLHQEEVMLLKEEMLDIFGDFPETVDIQNTDTKPLVIGETVEVSNNDENAVVSEMQVEVEMEEEVEMQAEVEDEEWKPKKANKKVKPSSQKPKVSRPKSDDGLNLFLRRPCGPKSQRRKNPGPKEAEMCPICGKFVMVLKLHMRQHLDDRRFQCPHCPKAFVARGSYLEHVNIHTREKLYKCDQCDKEFAQRNGWKAHKATHAKEFKFPCPVCEKVYYQRSTLTTHKRIHFKLPTIKCPECDHMSFSNGELKLHFRKHLPDRPFVCELCGRAFNRKDTLTTHMKIHRKRNTDSDSGKDVKQLSEVKTTE
nr:zinc finger protein OZF-like [Aedes albopictus]XP_019555402.2 zinc finger protein OZF-like [Aedes albopictus]